MQLWFVYFFDETRLIELGNERVVDKLLGLGGFSGRIHRKIEQCLHTRRRNVRSGLPNFGIRVVGLVQIFLVFSLGILADDLLRGFRVGAGDFASFNVGLDVTAHFIGIIFDK